MRRIFASAFLKTKIENLLAGSGTVNSKSFVGKVCALEIKQKFELNARPVIQILAKTLN